MCLEAPFNWTQQKTSIIKPLIGSVIAQLKWLMLKTTTFEMYSTFPSKKGTIHPCSGHGEGITTINVLQICCNLLTPACMLMTSNVQQMALCYRKTSVRFQNSALDKHWANMDTTFEEFSFFFYCTISYCD